jgi:hypothetical protein
MTNWSADFDALPSIKLDDGRTLSTLATAGITSSHRRSASRRYRDGKPLRRRCLRPLNTAGHFD